MSRSLRRGAIAAAALVISIAPLTACGAGNTAQTLGVKPDNAATSVGDIKIQNAVVITQPEGAEGQAVVSATLFNDGTKQQTLDSITLPGTNLTVKLTPASGSGPVTVPADGSVILGGKGNPAAVIENGRGLGEDGEVQRIAFRFSETGDVALDAFVVPADGYYRDYGPSVLPKPPAETPAASPSGSASAPAEGQHGGEGEGETEAEHGAGTEGETEAGHGGETEGESDGGTTPAESPAAEGTGH